MTNRKLTRKRSALNPEPSMLCCSSWKKISTVTTFKLKLFQLEGGLADSINQNGFLIQAKQHDLIHIS